MAKSIVENVLQIGLFLQNKANFRKSQMDIKLDILSDYEKKLHRTLGENKPNQSQFPIILVSLNWLCIISLFVIVTAAIFMESI